MTCREAIAKTWPAPLQAGAIQILIHENGSERADRVSKPNYDGSLDMGCMQVNDKAHFGTKGWTNKEDILNAEFNTAYAYKIFQSRHFRAWYAVCPANGSNPYGLCHL